MKIDLQTNEIKLVSDNSNFKKRKNPTGIWVENMLYIFGGEGLDGEDE